MAILTLNISINSDTADGKVIDWNWSLANGGGSTELVDNPPPRVTAASATGLQVIVVDGAASPPPTLDGFLTLSPKVENPLIGLEGPASPIYSNGSSPSNIFAWLQVQGNAATRTNGNSYVFSIGPSDDANSTLQKDGSWEATFVVVNRVNGNQYEIDPEFDVGT
jgi:hypothetical protein